MRAAGVYAEVELHDPSISPAARPSR
jgi:hypothetical protein